MKKSINKIIITVVLISIVLIIIGIAGLLNTNKLSENNDNKTTSTTTNKETTTELTTTTKEPTTEVPSEDILKKLTGNTIETYKIFDVRSTLAEINNTKYNRFDTKIPKLDMVPDELTLKNKKLYKSDGSLYAPTKDLNIKKMIFSGCIFSDGTYILTEDGKLYNSCLESDDEELELISNQVDDITTNDAIDNAAADCEGTIHIIYKKNNKEYINDMLLSEFIDELVINQTGICTEATPQIGTDINGKAKLYDQYVYDNNEEVYLTYLVETKNEVYVLSKDNKLYAYDNKLVFLTNYDKVTATKDILTIYTSNKEKITFKISQ